MIGWHHQCNGHVFQQALGDGEGQGSLRCCSPWGCKESDTTEQLSNNNESTGVERDHPCCLNHGHVLCQAGPGDILHPGSCLEARPLVLVSSLSEAVSSQTPVSVPAVSIPPLNEHWCLTQALHQ